MSGLVLWITLGFFQGQKFRGGLRAALGELLCQFSYVVMYLEKILYF